MQRLSEAQLTVLLYMLDGYKMQRVYNSITLEMHERSRYGVVNVHRNIFNALYNKGLIELSQKVDEDRRWFCLTKRAADLPLGAWKNYYLAKAANR